MAIEKPAPRMKASAIGDNPPSRGPHLGGASGADAEGFGGMGHRPTVAGPSYRGATDAEPDPRPLRCRVQSHCLTWLQGNVDGLRQSETSDPL